MKSVFKKIKEEQKELASKIRILKHGRKPKNYIHKIHKDLYKLDYFRNEYRHIHIAYCEFRGTPRSLIENPKEENRPNNNRINNLKKEWESEIERLKIIRSGL